MNNFDSILHILYRPPDFDKTSPILIMENEISGSLLSNFLTSFSHFTTTWLINELGLSIESFSEDVKSEESLYAAIAEALTNDLILIFFFNISTMLYGWVGLVIGHLGIIFAMYATFKQFHNARKKIINYKKSFKKKI